MNKFFRPVVQAFLAAPACAYFGSKAVGFCEEEEDGPPILWNWAGTTKATPQKYFEPNSSSEVCDLVKSHHSQGQKLRILGSALSPNGLGFSNDNIMCMCNQDKIINIDPKSMTVTVEAGCRIREICEALLEHNLTLQNLASIAEQQAGGFTQVGAHGTGWNIPPVDMQVIGIQAYIPTLGMVQLDQNSDLFYWIRLALGALGVITQVTLQCVPAYNLQERVFTLPFSEAKKVYKESVASHRHMRCLHIPYANTTVFYELDEIPQGESIEANRTEDPSAMRNLVREIYGDVDGLDALSFAGLRDELLKKGFNNLEHVKKVNEAEASYWKSIKGIAVGRSDELLHFDCGGQQLVLETCFPVHGHNEFEYMEELMEIIEKNNLPAPAPIEQRWTSRSTSKMSPAYSEDPDQKFCWIGIIMYLPTQDPEERDAITSLFRKYTELMRPLMQKHKAQIHWAKVPFPEDQESATWMQNHLKLTYPIAEFNELRKACDPNNVLANDMIDILFSETKKDSPQVLSIVA